ncbi:MAG: signal peptide peptidase SppA, partial [Pseudomonadota bacterium]
EMEIDGALPESAASSPLGAFSDTDNSLQGMLAALDAARTDARIVGVFLRIGAQPLPMAQAQELRNALSAFRDVSKPVLAFSESYDDVGFGTGFYLAAAADEVWLQPSGEIGMTGLAIETPYVRELLDEVGILPEFGQRKDYKSFPDTFLRERSSQANKEALQSLAGSLVDQLATGIAESRDLSPASVRAAIDAAPLLATEAADRGLIDQIGYTDEAEARLRQRVGPGSTGISIEDYAASSDTDEDSEPSQATLAVISASGPIHRGESDFSAFEGSTSIGSDTLVALLRDAADDEDVDAIILRIDSPGGSYVASDTVWREIVRIREGHRGNPSKPVIATMGSVAASGGYYIAMAADRIVAHPATLTGSIGVFSGKFSASELWDRLGIAWDTTKVGQYADMMSLNRGFTDEEVARMDRWLDTVYADFVGKAAQSRQMTPQALEAVAQGRVWTGVQARDAGLIDALGGFDETLEVTRAVLGLEEDAPVDVIDWGVEDDPLEILSAVLNEDFALIGTAVRGLAYVGHLGHVIERELGLAPTARQELSVPPPYTLIQ